MAKAPTTTKTGAAKADDKEARENELKTWSPSDTGLLVNFVERLCNGEREEGFLADWRSLRMRAEIAGFTFDSFMRSTAPKLKMRITDQDGKTVFDNITPPNQLEKAAPTIENHASAPTAKIEEVVYPE